MAGKKQNRMHTSIKYLSTIVLIIVAFCSSAQDPKFHIYLCFGQSNMNGSADFEAQDTSVSERFKVLQAIDCEGLGRSKKEWYTAVPPLCRCNSGLSPADYFGRTMVENLPEHIKIGVINVAIPGCDIRLFDKDIYTEFYKTHEKEWFMNRIKEYDMNPYLYLMDLARFAQKKGVIKGILLHQGETNAGQEEWPSYVEKIYKDMLTDLSLYAESVPLLAGEMVSVEDNCCAHMNEIINRLPEIVPTAHVISSRGCTAMDKAHFDAAGYREMGRRYAYEMLEIKSK